MLVLQTRKDDQMKYLILSVSVVLSAIIIASGAYLVSSESAQQVSSEIFQVALSWAQ